MMTETVIRLLASVRNDASLLNSLAGSSHVLNDSGLDSLELISFMLELESELCLEIDFETLDYDVFSSIDAFAKHLDTLMQQKPAA